jgi:DNA-binding MarR family transcriptional regulator
MKAKPLKWFRFFLIYTLGGKEKALRMIEELSADQARILAAFGHEVARGVLQKIKRNMLYCFE